MSPPSGSVEVPLRIGRYTLYNEIATGGMARVHIARMAVSPGVWRTVAVKRLHRQHTRDDEFRAMFLDEANLASKIHSPYVVPILDVVTSPDEICIVMEYVAGESLSSLLRIERERKRRMPVDVATAIVRDVLFGLHAAHRAVSDTGLPLNIVHRDVSPQNVIVGIDGHARVIDFGIAKAENRMQHTRDGQLKGKLSYMSPEQLTEKPVTPATDVYAAGVVLWECLMGHKLFDSDEPAVSYRRITEGELKPLDGSVPPPVARAILRALERESRDRYKSAQEMGEALDGLGPASPNQVTTWLGDLARLRLETRLNLVRSIEGIAEADPGPPSLLSSTPPMQGRIPSGPPSVPHSVGPATMRSSSKSAPDLPPTDPPPPSHQLGAFSIPPLKKPEIEVEAVAWRDERLLSNPVPVSPRPKNRSIGPWILLAIFALVMGAYLAAPWWIARKLEESMRPTGLRVTVDRVALKWNSIDYSGLTLTDEKRPGFSIKILRANVLHGLWEAKEASLDEVELEWVGSLATFRKDISDYWSRSPLVSPTLSKMDVRGGTVHVRKGLGPNTDVELGSIQVTSHFSNGVVDDIDLGTPLVRIYTRDRAFGPFSVHYIYKGAASSFTFTLPDGGRLSSTLSLKGDGFDLKADLGATKLSKLGIAPVSLGLEVGPDAFLECAIDIRVAKGKGTGKVAASLYPLLGAGSLSPGGALSLDVTISAGTANKWGLDGAFAYRNERRPVQGEIVSAESLLSVLLSGGVPWLTSSKDGFQLAFYSNNADATKFEFKSERGP